MKLETTFDCGDKAWAFNGDRGAKLVTIGMVKVEYTDSQGEDQSGIEFDNYKPQNNRKEQYMCVETGIGSGSVYTLGEHIFKTEGDCIAANATRIADNEDRLKRQKDEEKRSLLAQELSLRSQLAKIEKIKLEDAESTATISKD